MLGADLRVLAPDARLSIMEVKWGLVPDMGGVALLRQLMPADRVRELTYTGRVVTGSEALALGLATRIANDPYAEALALARLIAAQSPDAVRAAKRLLLEAEDGASEAEILLAESRAQSALLGSPNQVEAVRATLEKRAPSWREPAV
jgi:enoyl-CoA hydratase/carnithine racemase